MLRSLRFGSIAGPAVLATLAMTAATMVAAAPSGATGPLKETSASFEMSCVVAPGVLNVQAKLQGDLVLKAPETVSPGATFDLTGVSFSTSGPKELEESFIAIGVHEIRGHITNIAMEANNLEPAIFNLAKPAEYPAGLPFDTSSATHIYAPALTLNETGRTFSFGPLKVTGSTGQMVSLEIGETKVLGEYPEEGKYEFVSAPVLFELEGFNEHGEKVIGPLQTGCAPPVRALMLEIPIGAGVQTAEYKNWNLTGSLTDKRLGQAITLPEGSTFNGTGELSSETGAGSVKGNVSIPPFTASFKLFGALPVSLGLTLSEAGPLEGAVAKSATVSGDESLSIPAKLNMGITSVKLFGLTVPTKCATAEPLALALSDNLTSEELLKQGWSFSGSTTIPKVKCEGGLLGGLFGAALSALLSGPENPYAIKVTAPAW